MTRRTIGSIAALAGTVVLLGAAATPALAIPGTGDGPSLGNWDGGVACKIGGNAIDDCVPVISRVHEVNDSWTRASLTCPIERPFVRVRPHRGSGNGWDWIYSGQHEPDKDIVAVRAATSDLQGKLVGAPSTVTISVDANGWSIFGDDQDYRFAIGCSSVAG